MAEPEKRCPTCGAVLPPGFDYCPSCNVLKDEKKKSGSISLRSSVLRNRIIFITLAVVALLMVIILPRIAVPDTATEDDSGSAASKENQTVTSEVSTAEEADVTDFSGATVDSLISVPGENGHTHLYSMTVTKEPTCSKGGVATYRCVSCGKTYTKAISKLGHDYAKATCTEPKTCKLCGKTTGSPLGHYRAGDVCSRCGYNFKMQEEVDAENARFETEQNVIKMEYDNKIAAKKSSLKDDIARMQQLESEIARLENEIKKETDDSEKEKLLNAKSETENQYNDLALYVNQQLSALENEKKAALQKADETHQAKLQQIYDAYH